MKLRTTLTLITMAGSLAGCSNMLHNMNPVNWFGSSNTAEKPAALKPFTASVHLNEVWHHEMSCKHVSNFTPAVVDQAVFATCDKGTLARFDLKSGNKIWETDTRLPISAGVGASATAEYVGTSKGELLAFDPQGKATWHVQLSSEVIGIPEEDNHIVVVRTGNGDIYGLNADTGKQLWRYQHNLPDLMLRDQSGVALRSGGVFAGYPGGKLVALSIESGVVGWEADVSVPHGATDMERVNDVVGTPVMGDGTVCSVTYQGRVACFNIQNGNQVWARDVSSTTGIAIDDNNVYVTDSDGNVHAWDKDHGAERWVTKDFERRNLTAPVVVSDQVIVGDYQGYLQALSTGDGHQTGRAATDGAAIAAQPVPLDGVVVTQTAKGDVYVFTVK